jgi:MYXO-CTERM domain-containing protein
MRAIETSTPERSFSRGFRVGVATWVGGALLTLSSSALAKPEFPGIIIDELARTADPPDKPASNCVPSCTLCHTSPSPDSENASRPIANNLILFRAPGPITLPLDPENLPVYLDALENDACANMNDPACVNGMCGPCDGDGDGVSDIAELRADSDPNGSGQLACPKYGCGARIAPEGSSRPLDGTAALAALSAAIVFVRRLRRR